MAPELAILAGTTLLLGLALVATRVSHARLLAHIRDVVEDVARGNPNRRVRSGARWAGAIERGLNRLTLSFQEALLDRRRAQEAQNRLITHVSHDLRTPLTSVLGYLDALITDPRLLPDERNEFLHVVRSKCVSLNDLIDELFALSLLDSDPDPPTADRLDLCALAQRVLLSFERDLEALRVAPEIEMPEHAVFVRAVALDVERVISNLVSNVIRHGQDVSRVRFSLAAEEGYAVCALEDDGRGIPAEDLPRLFDDPYAARDQHRRPGRSRGLGLHVVRRLLERAGGDIQASSAPGSTAFTFRLPLAAEVGR